MVLGRKNFFTQKQLILVQRTYLQIYLLNLILNFCLFYNANCPVVIKKGIGLLLMLGGLALASINILETISKKKIDCIYFLLAGILGFMLLSGVANFQYGITGTLKIVIWSIILFFLVFPYFSKLPKEKYIKAFGEIVFPALIVWGIMEVVALIQFLFQITYFVKLPEYPIAKAQGVYYNRVFGIFVDASMASTLSWNLLLCGILIRPVFKNQMRTVVTLTIVLNWIYIVLSGGRSAVAISVIGFAVCIWVYIVKWQHKGHYFFDCFIALFLSSSLLIGGVSVTKVIMVQSAKAVGYISVASERLRENLINSDRDSSFESKPIEISLERTDLDGKEDITNRRTELWKESLIVYSDHPFFGVSLDGFTPYMKEKYEDTFAASGFDVGNGYLSVLVYAGPVAFILMILFMVIEVKRLFSYFWVHLICDTSEIRFLIFFAIVTSVAVAAMINMDIFYINSADSMLFWLTLGALNALYKKDKEEIIKN